MFFSGLTRPKETCSTPSTRRPGATVRRQGNCRPSNPALMPTVSTSCSKNNNFTDSAVYNQVAALNFLCCQPRNVLPPVNTQSVEGKFYFETVTHQPCSRIDCQISCLALKRTMKLFVVRFCWHSSFVARLLFVHKCSQSHRLTRGGCAF